MTALCNKHPAIILWCLISLPFIQAMGRVPDGSFSSEESTAETVADAAAYCDTTLSCAGMTYRPNQDEEEEHDWTVYFHSFLPPLLNNSKEHDWITERSDKDFVLHPGKLSPSSTVLDLNDVDPSTLTLHDAQELCKNHTECAAFSYPVTAPSLDGFDEIIFSSSVEGLDDSLEQTWQTFVVNQDSTADKANVDAMHYYEEHPYDTCCDYATLDSMPSIEEVERMDTLPRIPCNISRDDFLAQYEMTRTPVILVGCDEGWSAKKEWTLERLTERFGDDDDMEWRVSFLHTPPHDFVMRPWMDIVNAMGQNKSVYIFDDLDDPGKISIEDDYAWPRPFVDKDLFPEEFPPGFGSRHWIGIGETGSGTVPHLDPHGTDAWNTLVSGHKWWLLYPNNAVKDTMVLCDTTCSEMEHWEAIDWFMSVGKDAARTTFAGNESPMHVLQRPGETIYVPYGMYHAVLNLDEAVAITANYGSPGNLQTVWEHVVRKGAEEDYLHMFNEVFTDEQQEAVMEGEIWPPEDYHGIVVDENGEFSYSTIYVEEDEEDFDEEEEEEDYDEEEGEL